jgi:hypothetical protein
MKVVKVHCHQHKSRYDRRQILGKHLCHIGESPQSTFSSFNHSTDHLVPLLLRFLGSELLSLLLTKLGINMDFLTSDDYIRRSLSLGMSCIANIDFRYRSIIVGTVRVGIFDFLPYS